MERQEKLKKLNELIKGPASDYTIELLLTLPIDHRFPNTLEGYELGIVLERGDKLYIVYERYDRLQSLIG